MDRDAIRIRDEERGGGVLAAAAASSQASKESEGIRTNKIMISTKRSGILGERK